MGAVVFSSHFSLYRDISRRVFAIVQRELGVIERYSIDECFFYVKTSEATTVAERIKRVVEKEVGVPISVGVAASKTQAKYASALAKRTTGVCVLSAEVWQSRQGQIPLRELWGVGRARAAEFTNHRLDTVADFLRLQPATVGQLFGVEGVRLWSECAAVSARTLSISHTHTPKSLMSSRSFAEASREYGVVEAALAYHLHEIVRDLQEQALVVTALRIFMYPSRHGAFCLQGSSLQMELPIATQDIFLLKQYVANLQQQAFKPDVPYKKVGIMVLVKPIDSQTFTLFPDRTSTTKILTDVMAHINKRHEQTVLRLGSVAVKSDALWLSRRTAISPDYTTNWKQLCLVRAR